MNIFDKSHKPDPKHTNTAEANDIPADAAPYNDEGNVAEIDRNAILNAISAYAISDTEIAKLFDDDILETRKNPVALIRTTLYLTENARNDAKWMAAQYDGATRSTAIRVSICLARRIMQHIIEQKEKLKP